MKLDEAKLKILENEILKAPLKEDTDLCGVDITKLLRKQATRGFIREYNTDGNFLNNLLRGVCYMGKYSPDPEENETPAQRQSREAQIAREKNEIQSGRSATFSFSKYTSMNPNFIQELIEVDEVMRQTQSSITEPMVLYRGTNENFDMRGMYSTSTDIHVAAKFAQHHGEHGLILKINIPAGCPCLKMHELAQKLHEGEEEIILPPCEDFQVEGMSSQEFEFEGGEKVSFQILEITVRPQGLAKSVLRVLHNLPDEYPRRYVEDPDFQFQEGLEMLEEYVAEEVMKGKIRIGDHEIDETPMKKPVFRKDEEKAEKLGEE